MKCKELKNLYRHLEMNSANPKNRADLTDAMYNCSLNFEQSDKLIQIQKLDELKKTDQTSRYMK